MEDKSIAAGLHAIAATRQTVDEIEEAIKAGKWDKAGPLYKRLEKEGHWGAMVCKKILNLRADKN